MILTGSPTFNLPSLAVELSYYRLFLVLALGVTLGTAMWSLKKSALDFKRSCLTLSVAALAFFVGARLFNAAIRPELYLEQPWRLWSLDASGLSLYGGLLAAIITTIGIFNTIKQKPHVISTGVYEVEKSPLIIKRGFLESVRRTSLPRNDKNLWTFADTVAPAFGLGLAVMRIGCFLNGCCFGRPTELPWGVSYPIFSDAHLWQMTHGLTGTFSTLPVHPTQIYEALYSLVGAGISYWLLKKNITPGVAVLAFIIWLTAFRLANHFVRALPYSPTVTLIVYPIFYVAILAACVWLLRKKMAQRAS